MVERLHLVFELVQQATLALRYRSYSDIPFYQRQWFCWTTLLFVPPIAVAVVITGDVYLVQKGKLRNFGPAMRLVVGVLALVWTNLLITSCGL